MYNIIKIYNKFDILKSIMFTDEVRIIEFKHRTKQLMQKKHSKNQWMENFKDSLKCSNVLEIWISEDYDRDETIIRDDGKEFFRFTKKH